MRSCLSGDLEGKETTSVKVRGNKFRESCAIVVKVLLSPVSVSHVRVLFPSHRINLIMYNESGDTNRTFNRKFCGFSSASQDKPTSPGGGGPGSNPGPTRY